MKLKRPAQAALSRFLFKGKDDATALKSDRYGRGVDVGFGMKLEKISGFMSYDGWWISLWAQVIACEAAHTYILSPSPKGALSRTFEPFSPTNALPYDEAVVENKLLILKFSSKTLSS
jgi:hypothetical protein